MTSLVRIRKFIGYCFHAKTKYRIHSPFVFDLAVNVFEDGSFYPGYKEAERRKKQWLHDRRMINRQMLGAKKSPDLIPVKVFSVAREECISMRYGRLLFRMVQKFKPANILELGTSLGISASYMAAANPDCKIYTIEGCPELALMAEETFNRPAAGQVEIVQGDFDVVLPGVLQRMGSLDMVFIDGNHRKEPVLNYFHQILERVHNDSVLIFDDIHWSAEMESAWHEICAHEKIKVTIDLFQLGLVFFKKELSKEDFIIRYF
jgi:predicted O-methyltransferase YrrM